LRDPAERAFSHYNLVASRHSLTYSLEQLLDNPALDSHEILHEGKYATFLKRFLTRYSPEQILVITYDDLRANPQAVYMQVCDYLGINSSPVPAHVNRRSNEVRQYRSRALYHAGRILAESLINCGLNSLRKVIKYSALPSLIRRMNEKPGTQDRLK